MASVVSPGSTLPGGKFEHHSAHRIAVLALEHEPAVVEHRNDQRGARMHDVLTLGGGAVRKTDAVTPDFEHAPGKHGGRFDQVFDQVRIVRHRRHSQSFAIRKLSYNAASGEPGAGVQS